MPNIAWIDLTKNTVQYAELDPGLTRVFLGGRGLGAKLLFDLVGPQIKPYDPENCLIITTGPFSGRPWPTASRTHVTFKSPATGAYGYANTGGHFGPELARAGFAALVISGKASTPVYLKVSQNKVEILSADELWGKGTYDTQNFLLGEDGENGKSGRVMCIGLAGENKVTISALINDYGRAAARGGPGAVMGSKNLKAIHVLAEETISSSPEFKQSAKKASQHLLNDPKNKSIMSIGTNFLLRIKNMSGDLPTKNHQLAQVPFIDKVDPTALEQYKINKLGCAACPIRCSRISEVKEGPYKTIVEGSEYETTDAFGPMCWNSNPEVIFKANYLCNDYGLDTISTGVTIAFAMECHQNNILSDSELSLEWGDADSILGLIERIGKREGIGDILAEGTRGAAAKIGQGAEAYAMQVKGLELPRQEPRFAKGFGLGHATSNRGADHLYGLPAFDLSGNFDVTSKIFPKEILDELMDSENETYKADMVVYGEHYCAITDSLGICKFSTVEEYSQMPVDLLPGLENLELPMTEKNLLEIGERIVNLERLFNVRCGLSRQDDYLPKRFTTETLPLLSNETDPVTGVTTLGKLLRVGQLKDFDAMLDRYYLLRGWDKEGCPEKETLVRLGLENEGKAAIH
ncbi:MAG: aldehyde ferredoxin oxidoreductase family protein [Leptolinea sp.]